MSKIVKYEWRSGRDTVGIVLVQKDDGRYIAYIGIVDKMTGGFNEEQDAQYIADWGAKLSLAEALAFFPNDINPDLYGD